MGYPPGWLKEAEVHQADVQMYDASGKSKVLAELQINSQIFDMAEEVVGKLAQDLSLRGKYTCTMQKISQEIKICSWILSSELFIVAKNIAVLLILKSYTSCEQ